jgi:hypothetical protein
MSRSLLAGFTNYKHQSFKDMLLDLEDWISMLNEAKGSIESNIQELKNNNYWESVYSDFRLLMLKTFKFFETSIDELGEILSDIKSEVRNDHVNRIRRLSRTAEDLDDDFGRIWANEYPKKNYGDKNFNFVEELYEEGRGMVLDMLDLSNLAERLEDFIGRKQNKVLRLKPEFYGLGIDLKQVFTKGWRLIKKILKLKN